MTRLKAILYRLLFPHPAWLLPLAAGSAAGLVWVFAAGHEGEAPAFAFYLLSSYTLVIWAARAPRLIRAVRAGPVAWLLRQPLGRRYSADIRFRGECALYLGLLSSLFFAAFKAVTSVLYRSVWFGEIAAYYLVLAVIRAALVRGLRRSAPDGNPQACFQDELRGYRRTGWLMLLLTSVMSGMVMMMVWDGQGYSYPEIVIYVCALYAFYSVIMSAVNLARFRGVGSPLLSASKAVSFAGAAMSILTLQTAMLAQFDTDGAFPRQLANALTGAAVLALCFFMAVYMIAHGKRLSNNEFSGRHTGNG